MLNLITRCIIGEHQRRTRLKSAVFRLESKKLPERIIKGPEGIGQKVVLQAQRQAGWEMMVVERARKSLPNLMRGKVLLVSCIYACLIKLSQYLCLNLLKAET